MLESIIEIKNIRKHFQVGTVKIKALHDVSFQINKNEYVALMGASGSGKSTLAYDTIFAEGQRRYIESLSSYARQFLGKLNKPEADYIKLEEYTRALFQRGSEMAAAEGLILVDTKYEFGMRNGEIILIDEIHTPDSSRFFYADGYAERQEAGEAQKQLSKEFVRQWLISNGFQGKDGQVIPEMNEEKITEISERYIELYEQITGDTFVRADLSNIKNRIKDKKHFF